MKNPSTTLSPERRAKLAEAGRKGGLKTGKPIEFYLTENSTLRGQHLRLRLLYHGILKEECAHCGLGPEWNGKKITIQLDHINGDSTDNRVENLRMLCPNCHSQTDTYARKKSC